MIPDFTNLTVEKCKEIALEYQKTRNPELFNLLLAKLDTFIVYCIKKYKKYVWFVRDETMQELYHTALIGVHKGVLTFHEEDNPSSLLWRIKNYLMEELRQEYNYKIEEKEGLEDEKGEKHFFQNKAIEEFDKHQKKLFISTLMYSHIINEYEKKLLRLRYLEELTIEEVSKEIGHVYSTTWIHLDLVIKKLKEKIDAKTMKDLFD
jgi:RNA polymerase sigma factor (sigma-70 family)